MGDLRSSLAYAAVSSNLKAGLRRKKLPLVPVDAAVQSRACSAPAVQCRCCLMLVAGAVATNTAAFQCMHDFLHLPALTGETVSEEYRTEYSTDRVEMHTGAVKPGQRVVLVRGRGAFTMVTMLDGIRAGLSCRAGLKIFSFCRCCGMCVRSCASTICRAFLSARGGIFGWALQQAFVTMVSRT